MYLFSHRKWWQKLFSRSPKPLPPAIDDVEMQAEVDVKIEEYASSPRLSRPPTVSVDDPLNPDVAVISSKSTVNHLALPDSGLGSSENSSETVSTHSNEGEGRHIPQDRKWATRWYWQFLVLIVRTFRESRHNLLSFLNVVQAVLLAVVVALVWFQVPKIERSISDGYGYVS